MSILSRKDYIKLSPKLLMLIKERLYLTLYFYTLAFFTTIAAVNMDMENLYYPIALLYNSNNYILVVLYYLHKISFLLIPSVCICDALCFFTLSTYLTRDVYYIKRMCNSFVVNEESICQRTIKNKLIKLIKFHTEIKM